MNFSFPSRHGNTAEATVVACNDSPKPLGLAPDSFSQILRKTPAPSGTKERKVGRSLWGPTLGAGEL